MQESTAVPETLQVMGRVCRCSHCTLPRSSVGVSPKKKKKAFSGRQEQLGAWQVPSKLCKGEM